MQIFAKANSTQLRARAVRFAAPLRVSRVALVLRATPDSNEGPAPADGTIFYGGKSYTDAEYKKAVESGTLTQAQTPGARGNGGTAAASLTFNDVMGFSGSVPEIANGRLAMLGFVAAVAAEFSSGESVFKQVAEEPTGIAAVFLLFIAASLAPAFQGSKGQTLGPLTPGAEMINGRAAMIGFAAMLIIEAVRGQPLF